MVIKCNKKKDKKVPNKLIVPILIALLVSIIYFYVDYLNILTDYFKLKFDIIVLQLIFIGYVFLSCILFMIYKKICGCNIFSLRISFIDSILVFVLYLSLFLIPVDFFCKHNFQFHILIFVIVWIISVIRFIILKNTGLKENKYQPNLRKLKALYDNTIFDANDLILLEDSEIAAEEDDILNLKYVMINLKKAIVNCNPKKSFVIGLMGEWGIGKTSILRLVQKQLDQVNMIFFDPWEYHSNNDLLEGFYDLLINYLNNKEKYEISSLFRKVKKQTIRLLDNKIGTNVIELFQQPELDYLKDRINDVLPRLGKTVIVIDNLDRINYVQLTFFLNIIKNLLDFKSLIFILCYDADNIERILKKNSEYGINFFDKIINANITVPFLDDYTKNDILYSSLKNLLIINDINIINEYSFKSFVEIISKKVTNIREIIRFINSLSCNLEVVKENKLNIIDFIGIEFIKYKNYDLYKDIYNDYNRLCNMPVETWKNDYDGYNDLFDYLFSMGFNHREDEKRNRIRDISIRPIYFSQKPTNELVIMNEIIEAINKEMTRYNNILLDLIDRYDEILVLICLEKVLTIVVKEKYLYIIILLSKLEYGSKIFDLLFILLLENDDIKIMQQSIDILLQKNPIMVMLFLREQDTIFLEEYSQNNGNYQNQNKENVIVNFHYIRGVVKKYIKSILLEKKSVFNKELYHKELLYIMVQYCDNNDFNNLIRDYLNSYLSESNLYKILSFFITEIPSDDSTSFSYIIEYDNIVRYLDEDKLKEIVDKIDMEQLKDKDKKNILKIYLTKKTLVLNSRINFKNI